MHTLPQKSLLAVFSAVLFVAESHGAEPKPEIADLKPEIVKFEPFTWPGAIPDDCPFQRSTNFNAVRFLGVKSGFRYGDTWYPTWAENDSWITGDQIYLLRVTPSVKTINDAAAYEFYGGKDKDGQPIWTNDFEKIKPLLEWDNNMGCVTATYNPVLKKYLMCVTDGGNTVSRMNTYLLEADRLDGDWKIIT